MKVIRPSKNRITQNYSAKHKAYDFSGKGDLGVYAAGPGKIIQRTNKYDTHWIQGRAGDPTPGRLSTEDLGNYIKIAHDDGTFSVYGHLQQDSMLNINNRVKGGQRIATIGHTGYSTGRHLHYSHRDRNNNNIKVEFVNAPKETPMSSTYKGLDLSNQESMKVAVDVWDAVMNQKLYIKKSNHDGVLKKKLGEAERKYKNSLEQHISQKEKGLQVKEELEKALGVTIKKPEDMTKILNSYYTKRKNEESKLDVAEKKEAASETASMESFKELMRYVVSMVLGGLVTFAYTQFPVLGDIAPDAAAISTLVVGLGVRMLDKYVHIYGKNKEMDLVSGGILRF